MLNSRLWRVRPTATVNWWRIVSVWFKADRPDRRARAHGFRIPRTTMAVSHRIIRLPFSQRNVAVCPFFLHPRPDLSRGCGRALHDRRPVRGSAFAERFRWFRTFPRHSPSVTTPFSVRSVFYSSLPRAWTVDVVGYALRCEPHR